MNICEWLVNNLEKKDPRSPHFIYILFSNEKKVQRVLKKYPCFFLFVENAKRLAFALRERTQALVTAAWSSHKVARVLYFRTAGGGGGRGYDSSHFGWDQTHGKFIWHYLAISKATAGEKHPQSGSQGACGSKNDPEATPEYKKMEKNSEKTAFFTFWPLWAK